MAINVAWHDAAETILHWEFVGRWNWRELNRAIESSEALLADQDHLTAIIYDVRLSGLIPADLTTHMRAIADTFPSRILNSRKYVVGADDYLQTFWRLFAQSMPPRWQVDFADSLEAAAQAAQGQTRDNHTD